MTEVIDVLAAERVLPVVVLRDARLAAPLGAALLAGGLRCVEITFRTAAAEAAIRSLSRDGGHHGDRDGERHGERHGDRDGACHGERHGESDGELIVGAGTVLTVDQADRAIDAGARFVVSPGFSPPVVRRCQQRSVPVFPGVATATEIQQALEAGLRTVKFFPAEQLGGPAMVKALAAPFGGVRFIPTGGVTGENVRRYLEIPSVLAVGGTWMVPSDLVHAERWDDVTALTAAAVTTEKSVTTVKSEGTGRGDGTVRSEGTVRGDA